MLAWFASQDRKKQKLLSITKGWFKSHIQCEGNSIPEILRAAQEEFSRNPHKSRIYVNDFECIRVHRTIYVLEKVIGRGGYGKVFKAVNHHGHTVAIKFLDDYQTKGGCVRESELHEIMGTSEAAPILHGTKYGIVMKYIQGRTLEQELLDPDSPYSPLDLYHQAKCLIKKLHLKRHYHGDTNTGNFMVENGQVYLIDYGNSGMIDNLEKVTEDYRKLASNVASELQFREQPDACQCREEAWHDYDRPEEVAREYFRL
jgi:serine/threonine protein kinase